MALLVSEGHTYARHYPVCIVWTEATIAQSRINQHLATEAVLVQGAILSALGGGKEFGKLIKELTRGHQ